MSEIDEPTEDTRLRIQTGIDPSFLSATITEDIQLTDALFDLFDNSIDAARNQITSDSDVVLDEFGLPSDYSGYELALTFDRDSIVASDNCMGFDEETLREKALFIGRRSDHPFGIGNYGVGLKRALMKAGEVIKFTTENTSNRYDIDFNIKAFGNGNEEKIFAVPTKRTGRLGTVFQVKTLKPGIELQLKDNEWYKNFVKEISVRYAIFIKKGLMISVDNKLLNQVSSNISASLPEIREGLPMPVSTVTIPEMQRVNTYIRMGVHGAYRFRGEQGHSQTVNAKISNEFGIYFICNDRVIVAHSTEEKHGFTTQWHNEYAGFVCIVRMVSDSPSALPWNTAKTELQTSGSFFLYVRKRIEPLAKDYRKKAKKIIKVWTHPSMSNLPESERKIQFQNQLGLPSNSKKPAHNLITPIESNSGNTSPVSSREEEKNSRNGVEDSQLGSSLKNKSEKTVDPNSHSNKVNTIVPKHFPQPSNNQNLNNMIIEAYKMDFTEAPHAASMLYRAILEGSSRHFANKTGNFQNVKDHFYSKGDGKDRKHSDEYMKSQGIDLTMTLKWLNDNAHLFPDPERKILKLCLKSALSDNQKLNGIVHCRSITNDAEFRIIRDRTIELVRFFISEAERKIN